MSPRPSVQSNFRARMSCKSGSGRRIFLRAENGPQHRAQKRRRADIKRKPDGLRNMPLPPPSVAMPNQFVIIHGSADAMVPPSPMNRRLDGEALRILFFRQIICHQRTKRLHAGVDGSVQHPEQPRRHPDRRAIRHQNQGERGENCAAQNKRPTPTQTRPTAVAGLADQGLDDDAGDGAASQRMARESAFAPR